MSAFNPLNVNKTGNYVEGVALGRARDWLARSSSSKIPLNNLRIASWNVGTLKGRTNNAVETRRIVKICCVQEVRWRGARTSLECEDDIKNGQKRITFHKVMF